MCQPETGRQPTKPLASVDVFIDDFIELAQGGPRRREALRNTLLHSIDNVLEP